MEWLLTAVLILVVFLMIAHGLMRRIRFYQLPFLAGVITFAFLLPQLPAFANDSFLPENAYSKTIAFTIACLLMFWCGSSLLVKPLPIFRCDFDERRLLIVALALSVLGAYFYFALSRLPTDQIVDLQMTGVPVIYVFFSRLLCYGLTIAALCFARRFSWLALFIIGFDLIFYFHRIVITGKRAETLEILMIFALAFWFYRGWLLPRSFVLIAILVGPLIMINVGEYRRITKTPGGPVWSDLLNIDVVGNLETQFSAGGPEMLNAILRIHQTDSTMDFDYGKVHWNRLIFNFVPAQILGADFKNSLMLEMPKAALDYNPLTGTTETGMSDAFQSFWYFGALKFLLLAYLINRIWVSANTGELAAQVVYCLSIVPGVQAITHSTDWVVPVWVHMTLFLLPALLFARVSAREKQRLSDALGRRPRVSTERENYAPAH